jgi:type I restriction enzyme M protein
MANNNNANFAWNIADHLRGTYKATDYGKIVIPFTILRRMDCILEDTKQDVLDVLERKDNERIENIALPIAAKQSFYNKSKFTLITLLNDPANIAANLKEYIDGFSDNVKDIFLRFRLEEQIGNLDENELLYLTVQKYASADFHPNTISNHEMGLLFEELIRKFAEDSAADNGEFFTPRDAITLLVQLLFALDSEALTDGAPIISIYDPTAGTGGMLSVASEWIEELNPEAELSLYGQELNPESYAICKSDMVAKGQNVDNIALGNTLTSDKHSTRNFDYVISNPPYGSKWEKEKDVIEREHKEQGFDGRFGPGLPASSDGQLLFLLHAVHKLSPVLPDGTGGGRAGVILNGSSLFSGDAGSGASNIRRWLFEQDYVDAIVALPTNMFYSTGIATYMWLIDTNKPDNRKGKVQLVSGTELFTKMRKSLGGKTRELSDANIAKIVDIYKTGHNNDLFNSALTKTFNTEDFGFRVVTVEQPLRKKYAWDETTAETLLANVSYQKLSADKQDALTVFAYQHLKGVVFNSYTTIQTALTAKAKEAGIKLTATDKKLLTDIMETEALGEGEVSYDSKGNIIPDPALRDTETIPLSEEVDTYIEREVHPFAPDAWVDETKTKIGYEIPFNRHFYKAEVQRSLQEIQDELKAKIAHITELLGA